VEVKFKKVREGAQTPKKHNYSDAGYDLFSCERHVIEPMQRGLIPVGISIEIPFGYYARIAPRSGLAVKKGIDVLAGVVDAGFRNEISVVLINLNLPNILFDESKNSVAHESMFGDSNRFVINPGERIAQLIIERCYSADWKESDSLNESKRGMGGFGSTGI
tara:strand:+ start:3171 stop:3656 length:486 start_codon:yes stop_codon:yes gene_type:complete